MSRRRGAAIAQMALVVALVVAPCGAPRVSAQTAAAPPTSMAEAYRLVFSGRNVSAVDLALKALADAPPAQWQAVFRAAVRLCVAVMDSECASAVLGLSVPVITAMPRPDVQPATGGYHVLLHGFLQLMSGQEAQFFGPALPNPIVNPLTDPVLFADLHLLAARQARLRSDFQAARDHLDKALVATLALDSERFHAIRLIVRIAGALLDNFEVERAVRLVVAATPLYDYLPPQSFLAYEYLELVDRLAGYRKGFDVVATGLRKALELLPALELRPAVQRELVASAYNELVVVELLRGDRDAARALLHSHPLAAARGDIVSRGGFGSDSEFYFAVAEELARAVLSDDTAASWKDLLTRPVDWTRDPERLDAMAAFGQAAVGLAHLRGGDRDEGRRLLVEAGRKRLASLQAIHARSVYAAPMPEWTDRLLLDIALGATFATGAPDAAFVVQAAAILNRSIETRPDDALALAAVQPGEQRRRWAQSLATAGYQLLDWERTEVVGLARRLSQEQQLDPEASSKRRLRLFASGDAFIAGRERLRQALAMPGGSAGIETLADLGAVQRLLGPDEAVLVHVPLLGAMGKLCIRGDGVVAAAQPADAAAVIADARSLRLALTAGHPASVDADSQYPVAEAIRLARLLLDGLEQCTAASRRLHVVGLADALAQVPPAALLREPPPRQGAGYDLRAARWLVRDHVFATTASIEAFVAARRVAGERTAVLDYLGVGNPVLATGPPSFARLPELPETSEELDRAAAAFAPAKVRLLTRADATQEAFRLQPLSEFDVLHFATHALVREELPGISEPALVFSPSPGGDAHKGDAHKGDAGKRDGRDDRLLGTSQIAALSLRARLVVLSACNSARYAPSIIDNGIQGLSVAFAIAGVPTTIAALWPLESTVARDVVGTTLRFARQQRLPIADALAAAVRRHLDGPLPRPLLHPRFWAGLVLLGDGALAFDADRPALPRALGPFAAPGHDSDDILAAASLGADFVSSESGPWNGAWNGPSMDARSPSLVRRRAADGAVRWQASDAATAAGRIAATTDTIYAAGWTMAGEGREAHAVPVLRAFDAAGALRWLQRLPAGPQSTHVMGLAVQPDGSGLALVGPPIGDANGARFHLLAIDSAGVQGVTLPIALADDARGGLSGALAVAHDAGLVAINRHPRREEQVRSFDWRGLPRRCSVGDGADLRLVGLAPLQERQRAHIDRLRVHDALAVDDGWLLVGDERDGCGLERHAAVWRLNADGSTVRLWRDASPFDTFGRGVRQTAGGLEVVGHARRAIPIHAERRPLELPDPAGRRPGDEADASGELFAVRLSPAGVEERRDFVAAGLPVVPHGLAASAERSVVFGSVGGRALWLAR